MNSSATHSAAPPGPIRIAYIISAYQRPEQLIRLVRQICHPDHWIFIHYDRRSSDHDFARLEDAFKDLRNVRLLKRHNCRWGNFGHVDATLKGIAEIARLNFPCDYAVLLTGLDYPVKPDSVIRQRLADAGERSFMEASSWPVPNWQDGREIRRLTGHHLHLPIANRFRDMGWPAIFNHIRIPRKLKIPGNLHPWFGSSYWYLHRRCLVYLWEYLQREPQYARFFRNALIPDETFFQTILMNSPLADSIERRSLTYVTWRPPWPGVLTVDDLPKLKECDHLFARKFNILLDAAVLDRLDEMNLEASHPVESSSR